MVQLDDVCVSPNASIRDAVRCMTNARSGIALVVNEQKLLLGVVTDGDIRRAIVAGKDLNAPAGDIATRHSVTASPDTTSDDLIRLMQATRKQAIPIVDSEGIVSGIKFLADLLQPDMLENYAVLMAGGKGLRLLPYTERVPKPMLKVGAKPIVEVIVERLVQQGLNKIVMLLHHMPEAITEHFTARSFGGREIEFVVEPEPLGTAGGLSLIRKRLIAPFLVLNGDNLIRANWRSMFLAHQEQGNQITIGATEYPFQIPYGVLETQGGRVVAIQEKPRQTWLTVCSVYAISPEVLPLLPDETPFDMPDLIRKLLKQGGSVGYFRLTDVTRIEDLVPSHAPLWVTKD